ncbi:MAG: positive regulator of sigma E activity [Maribacter sp.]|jgi:positive regulator of sigma E activity
MNLFKKTYWIIFPLIMFICLLIMDKIFNMDNFLITAAIAGAIAFILAPRKKKIKTQTVTKTQVTWIFLKKPIIID